MSNKQVNGPSVALPQSDENEDSILVIGLFLFVISKWQTIKPKDLSLLCAWKLYYIWLKVE